MRDFDCVIFDWAGTTVDYGCFAPVQAFLEVFRHYGINPTMEEVREPMGMLKIDHIRTMLNMPRIKNCWIEKYDAAPTEEDVHALFGIFEEKLLSILHLYADPKPDTVEAVKRLRAAGYAIGSTTGYTDKMMDIVAPIANEKGYAPDCWFSPDSTGQKGRPWPYMIYRNLEVLGIQDVRRVIKIGDTVSDIREGKNAGAVSAGIVIGSSEMGLSIEEFESMAPEKQADLCNETRKHFLDAGADMTFLTLSELADYLKA